MEVQHGKLYWYLPDKGLIESKTKPKGAIPMVRVVENGDDMQKFANQTIFRKKPEHTPKGLKKWILTKWLNVPRDQPLTWRYYIIHVFLKNKIVKPAITFLKKCFGKYLIKDINDIDKLPHNNHLRMFYYCFEKAFFNTIGGVPYDAHKKRPEAMQHYKKTGELLDTREKYEKWCKETNFWSYDNRMSLLRMYMTEVLEDTFDREHINNFMLETYWELHHFYKGKVPKPGEYPVYASRGPTNPVYFKLMSKYPVWEPFKELVINVKDIQWEVASDDVLKNGK